jgi:hypothetical protein
MADVTFDGTAKLIIVNTGITELSAADIYSWWKQWVKTQEPDGDHNAEWLPAFRTIGGDPVGPGVDVSAYFFLINGWRIRPYEGQHQLVITGNLYVEGGIDNPFVPTVGNYNVLVTTQVSPQSQRVTAGVGTAAEVATAVWDADLTGYDTAGTAGMSQKCQSYDKEVVYDSVNGQAGTAWPIGTHRYPVNNLTDALIIMNNRNLDTLKIHNDITITNGSNIDGKKIETMGIMGTTVTFEAGCSANRAAIRYANVQGELTNGDILLMEACTIFNLENFSGVMNNVAFGDGAEIIVGTWATIIQGTAGGDPTNEPEIKVGNASVNLSHITGNLKINDKTGGTRTIVNMTSGNLLIGSGCVAGTIQVLGTGRIEQDDSGASCTVDIEGFISIDNIWGTPMAEHVDVDSVGEALDRIDKNAGLIPATV